MTTTAAATSLDDARVGGVINLQIYTGPNYAAPALTPVVANLNPSTAPIAIPGIDGSLNLDPSGLVVVGAIQNSTLGVGSLFLPVPNNSVLANLDIVFQHLVLVQNQSSPAFGAPVTATLAP